MSDSKTYKVQVNITIRIFREIALALFFVAFVGGCLWYVIDLPVKDVPDLRPAYYINLPTWLLYIFGESLIIGIVALLFYDVRKNSHGLLKFDNDSVNIESKGKFLKIKLKELKRIVVVVKELALKPYRIEFMYSNRKFVRVIVPTEIEFEEILEKIASIAPEQLDSDIRRFESIEED